MFQCIISKISFKRHKGVTEIFLYPVTPLTGSYYLQFTLSQVKCLSTIKKELISSVSHLSVQTQHSRVLLPCEGIRYSIKRIKKTKYLTSVLCYNSFHHWTGMPHGFLQMQNISIYFEGKHRLAKIYFLTRGRVITSTFLKSFSFQWGKREEEIITEVH